MRAGTILHRRRQPLHALRIAHAGPRQPRAHCRQSPFMKTAFRLALLAVIGGLGFWLWTVLFPSPEKIVLKKISNLAATASFEASASNLTRAGKAGSVVKQFASDA